MYSVTWHVYPNGIEGEEMDTDFEYFKSLAFPYAVLRCLFSILLQLINP